MSDPNDLKSLQNYWNEVKNYLLNLTSINMESEDNIKNNIEVLSLYFSPFILELLSNQEKERLINYLLEIRKYFINKKNYTLSSEHCSEVETLVNEAKDYFNKIGGNIPNLAILEKYNKAIKEQQKQIKNRANDLFGELATRSISKPFKEQFDEYSKSKLSCVFWLLIIGLFIWIISFDCITNFFNLSFQASWEKILFRIFSSTPIIWGILFTSRKISENKKIEQTYLHKYTVSQSYLNYLVLINTENTYITNIKDREQALQILHKIVVESLSLNPALLLDKSTSEKIPMEELLSRILDKTALDKKS